MLLVDAKYSDNAIIKMLDEMNINFWDMNEDNWEDFIGYDDFPEDIREYIRLRNGASKLVIVAPEIFPFVIKMPFRLSTASYYDDYDYEEYDEEGCGYCQFEGADNGLNDWDYCLTETQIYEHAKEFGVEEFFAASWKLGELKDGFPIYAQEYIPEIGIYRHEFSELSNEDVTAEEYITAYTISSRTPGRNCDIGWREVLYWLQSKTKETVSQFIDFLQMFEVSDLHTGNGGLTAAGDLVLIDYSGFND